MISVLFCQRIFSPRSRFPSTLWEKSGVAQTQFFSLLFVKKPHWFANGAKQINDPSSGLHILLQEDMESSAFPDKSVNVFYVP